MRLNTDEEKPVEVDLAPLIDCVFLLLIFFLVATQLKEFENHVSLPQADPFVSPASEASLRPPSLFIKDGRASVGGSGWTSLSDDKAALEMVRAMIADYPEKRIDIRPHPDAEFQDVLKIVDMFKTLGKADFEVTMLPNVGN